MQTLGNVQASLQDAGADVAEFPGLVEDYQAEISTR